MSKIVLLFVNCISKCPSASSRVGAVLSAVHGEKGTGVWSLFSKDQTKGNARSQHPLDMVVEGEGWCNREGLSMEATSTLRVE